MTWLPVIPFIRFGFGSVWCCSVSFGFFRFLSVSFGLVWFGLVWFGLVRFDLVRFGSIWLVSCVSRFVVRLLFVFVCFVLEALRSRLTVTW